jgi:hypothetical protein
VYNCIITYTPFPLSQVASLFPIAPATRPLSEHQESGQSDRGAPKCAHQSNPGLLGRACAPVQLNQNQNNRTARAGAGRTELASQSEAARATRLFATEQSGINGARLYRRIGGMRAGQGYVQRIGGCSTEGRYSTACIYRGLKPSYSTPSISLSLQSIDTSKY